ncbi:MAG: AI-2E family transporter [Bacillota bacterium]|nr:AI-2E family transporter [Bacillota bacterium]
MEFSKKSLEKDNVKRIIALVIIIILMYAMKSLFNMLLLTFLFSYFAHEMEMFITKKLSYIKFIKIPRVIIILLIYIVIIGAITIFIVNYVPSIVNQSTVIFNQIKDFAIKSKYSTYFDSILNQIDISKYTNNGVQIVVDSAKNISQWGFNIFMAIVLSLFYNIEREKLYKYVGKFENSRISFIYKYIKYFGKNFMNSFAKVIQTQVLIAFVNSLLSMVALTFMKFPQVLGLGVMIFVLSLIPVVGTIISLVPLSIIAVTVGGPIEILYVVIMIAALHALESYVLNPKLMADKTELPAFVTFLVLIVSEHFMGTWGLLLGIPIFMFLTDLAKTKDDETITDIKSKK